MRKTKRENSSERNSDNKLMLARRFAGASLFWENFWPRAVPLVGAVGCFLIISWLGIWPELGIVPHIAILALLFIFFGYGVYQLRAVRLPTEQEINSRVERASKLNHRPVTTKFDQQAGLSGAQSPFARALWKEHKLRAAEAIGSPVSGMPNPKVARKDPYGFRALVGLGLFVSLMTGWGELGDRIQQSIKFHAGTPSTEARIDAWVTAPAYTNKPPLFLNKLPADTASISVPEGSKLLVRVLGMNDVRMTVNASGATDVVKPVSRQDGNTSASANSSQKDGHSFEFNLERSSTLSLGSAEHTVREWQFSVIPDHDPSVQFVEAPQKSLRGVLEFSYTAKDDYGLASAQAHIRPVAPTKGNSRPLIKAPDIHVALPGRQQIVAGFKGAEVPATKSSHDLTSHPWAGAQVTMHLEVTDQAGQIGKSEIHEFRLPERVFVKPLALALVDERRNLALDANQAKEVAEMLDIITSTHPDTFIENLSVYTAMRVAYRTIKRAKNDDELRDALELMWEIALAVEDGDLSLAERRLRDAQERLARALEEDASDEEISRLMQELRNAMNDFLTELADQLARNPQNQQAMPLDPNNQVLRQQDLNKLLEQIENLAKSGSRDAARQLLEEMQRMMNNLQTARPQPNQQQTDELSKQMNKLGDMMRRQQQLMDETFGMQRRQQQMQRNQGQQGEQGQQRQPGQEGQQGQQQGGEQRPMTEEEFAEAMRQLRQQQQDLQNQMQQLQRDLEGLGMQPSEQLGEAEGEMGGAEENLGKGNTGDATGNQGRALQAMRRGAQSMMQNMQNQAGEQGQRGQRGQHGQQTRGERDPLGRASRSSGPQLGDDVKVPNEVDAQRARDILNAIRRRLSDPSRPRLELDYLDRLLPTQ